MTAGDPVTIALVVVALAVVPLLANLLRVSRAVAVDTTRALRGN